MPASRKTSTVWPLGTALIALPVAVPIVTVALTLFSPASDAWVHLRRTVLTEYVLNTMGLITIVAGVTLIVGVSTAWLTATKSFPGRRLFTWALILPFAAPAYVVAYAYGDLLDFSGPVQSLVRDLTGWGAGEYTFPDIRSLPGAGLVLGFVLYPYVYLLAYTAFSQQSGALSEAARALGAGGPRAFFTVALPVARPAVAGGLALALMETVADYGVVDFYGVPTFTTGIFRTWYALGEHQAAVQLAAWLFVVAAVLVAFEQLARRGRVANPLARDVAPPLERLTGGRAAIAVIVCAMPVALGFAVPVAVLGEHAWTVGDPMVGRAFGQYVGNTVFVAAVAAAGATAAAIWLCYSARLKPTRTVRLGIRTATLGYALPGMVLAVGMIVPLTTFDRWLAGVMTTITGTRTGLLLTGTIASLVFVYIARFLTVAYNSCDSGMARIHPQLEAAGRSLGAGPGRVLREVHLPLMLPAVASAALLVFIDIVKELPATLILRPFNFETLATRAYRLASDERLAEASTAALTMVLVGLVPTMLLGLQSFRRRVHAP